MTCCYSSSIATLDPRIIYFTWTSRRKRKATTRTRRILPGRRSEMDVRETVCKAPLRRGFLLPAKKSDRRVHHVFQQRAQQLQRRLLPLHIPAHQPYFQGYPWFAQGFPQQRLAVVFVLGASGQYCRQLGV